MAPPSSTQFQPKDAIGTTIQATAVTGAAGLTVSAIQNTLTKQHVSAWGVFTRSGSTMVTFAAMGGSYAFVKTAAANLREKDDSWNPALGGFVGGAMVGLRFRTMPAVLGYGAGLAILMAAFDYSGSALTGYTKSPDHDEYEYKEYLRKNRRRPIHQTIEELGEGRGIYGPGYEERRRQRIKEKYGYEIPEQLPSASP